MTSDYPLRALRENRGGVVGFLLKVDPKGQVSSCVVTSSSGSPDLDAATCSLVTLRASFKPATDPKGKKAIGSYAGRVRWVIPENTRPNPFVDVDGRFVVAEITFRFFIEPDGSTSDCVLITNNTAETLERPEGPCAATKPYKPYLDAKGKPVRKRASLTVTSTVDDSPQP